MTAYDPARSREQRKQDTLHRLRQDDDAWVATASPDGVPTLVPLSFLWEEDTGTLVMATRRTNPTAVNVTPDGPIRVTLGPTRDVVLIEGEARILEGADLPPRRGRPSSRSSGGTRVSPSGCFCTSPPTPCAPGAR